MRVFEFYLTAYQFCREHNIDPINITKRSFKEWQIDTDIMEEPKNDE